MHVYFVHKKVSSNPLGTRGGDVIPFYPHFVLGDLISLKLVGLVFSYIVFLKPFLLGDRLNFIIANPLETPFEICPEWYFLPY